MERVYMKITDLKFLNRMITDACLATGSKFWKVTRVDPLGLATVLFLKESVLRRVRYRNKNRAYIELKGQDPINFIHKGIRQLAWLSVLGCFIDEKRKYE